VDTDTRCRHGLASDGIIGMQHSTGLSVGPLAFRREEQREEWVGGEAWCSAVYVVWCEQAECATERTISHFAVRCGPYLDQPEWIPSTSRVSAEILIVLARFAGSTFVGFIGIDNGIGAGGGEGTGGDGMNMAYRMQDAGNQLGKEGSD
jgi:hypothetical protein